MAVHRAAGGVDRLRRLFMAVGELGICRHERTDVDNRPAWRVDLSQKQEIASPSIAIDESRSILCRAANIIKQQYGAPRCIAFPTATFSPSLAFLMAGRGIAYEVRRGDHITGRIIALRPQLSAAC
jgi:hypothetical protein